MWVLLFACGPASEEDASAITVVLANDGPDPVHLLVPGELQGPDTEIAPFRSREAPFRGAIESAEDGDRFELTVTLEVTAARDGEILEVREGSQVLVGCASTTVTGEMSWGWSGLALEEGVHELDCE